MSGKSTPQTNPKKKRPLSSPADQSDLKKTKPVIEADGSSLPIAEEPESSVADQSDLKKTKPVIEADGSSLPIAEEPEAGSAPTQITLSEENLTQISGLLRSSFENQLPALVSDIVEGVVKSLKEKIASLSDENANLRRRVEELELKVERAEQYSRRNCLRMSGISETDNESVDEKGMQVTTAIGSDIALCDIDRCHRLGRPRTTTSGNQMARPRDIIIKFTSFRARQKVLKNKSKLRASGFTNVYVNENLKATRVNIFFQTRKLVKDKLIHSTWTSDGTIIVKDKHLKIHRLESHRDLERFKSSMLISA